MAKRFRLEEKPNTQRSVRYFVQRGKEREDIYTALYPHMLIEDLHLGVMPIGWQPGRFKFECKLEPRSPNIEKMLIAALPTRHGEPRYFTEAICDFVEEAAQIMAFYGRANYEIVYTFADNEKRKIDGFQFVAISNSNIHNFCGVYWQLLPKEFMESEWRHMNKHQKSFIWLPRENLFILDFPSRLGGRNGWKKVIDQLAWVSKETIPKFSMKDLELQKQQAGYDFSIYREKDDIFVLKRTKHIGWPARSLSSEKVLEFYQLYRYLKFEWAKAILREYIIARLNRKLKGIGKKVGFNSKIILSNCFSSETLKDYIEKLFEGKLQFSELVKITRFN